MYTWHPGRCGGESAERSPLESYSTVWSSLSVTSSEDLDPVLVVKMIQKVEEEIEVTSAFSDQVNSLAARSMCWR